jgi:arylsulfatase A-like enzyme
VIKNIKKSTAPVSGSIILFLTFAVYGLINNPSSPYIGNSTGYAGDLMLNSYIPGVVFIILKLAALYLLSGTAFGIVSLFIVDTVFSNIIKTGLSLRIRTFLNGLTSLILYSPFFLKDLINYPQMYINGFYAKSSITAELMNLMADNLNPLLFTSIQILFAIILAALIIYRIVKYIKDGFFIRNIKIPVSAAVVIILAIIVFTNSQPDENYNRENDAPNIIIFSSDALRPDHLSGFGYVRNTSPNIDRLLADGISFMDTRIEMPEKFPSWVSILTGQYASSHGIRHNFPASADLNKSFTALPGILDSKGYYTSLVADNAGDIFTGINLGFENANAPSFKADYKIHQKILDSHIFLLPFLTGEAGLILFPVLKNSSFFCPPELVKKRIIKSIEKAGGRPFFITSLFSSTHSPYAQVYPYYKMFSTRNYRGPHKFLKQQKGSNNTAAMISAADKNQINALYDGGIKAFDQALGEVLDYLEQENLLENTIIMVVSDRGENLYDGTTGIGNEEHFRGQYSTRIPFIISNENLIKKNIRIPDTVRHVDIAPTILAMLEINNTAEMEGVSLIPLIEGKPLNSKLYAFGENGIWFDNNQNDGLFFMKQSFIYHDKADLTMISFQFNNLPEIKNETLYTINLSRRRYIYDGKYKLIYIPTDDKVIYEMYDTEEDPEETVNIASKNKADFNRLKEELFRWIQRNNDVIIKDDFVFLKTGY